MAESKPGDGKQSPFGNGMGKGGEKGGGGNDFVTNPSGNPASGTKPRDFLNAHRPQQAGQAYDLNPDQSPEGGLDIPPMADPKGDDKGNPVGTLPDGGGRKPFKLGGGEG